MVSFFCFHDVPMDWLYTLINSHTAIQAVIVISLICAVGLMLGRLRLFGISLGVTFVFFTGILAGHLGLSIDPQMLIYAEDFGLVVFVYALGLQVGPGFFSSFRKGGVSLNLLAVAVIILGTLLAVALSFIMGVSIPDMVGILSGATTNTPALAAEQQTLQQLGLDTSSPALGCAVTYPLGVVGVILCIILLRILVVRKKDTAPVEDDNEKNTYIAAFKVSNPGIFGKTVKELGGLTSAKFIISRLWRDNSVRIPTSGTVVQEDDRVLVIASEKDIPMITALLGMQEDTDWNKKEIDWNSIDSRLVSQRIVVTQPGLNGRNLASLHFRNEYGVNVSRVYRSGMPLLATAHLTLQLGDRLCVVGDREAVKRVEKVVGNAVRDLEEPNLVAVFVGMFIGLVLGSVPVFIPGMSSPLKLGLAGGPIIVGILISAFGPRIHMVTYTTRSANLMLRAIGLSTYLACLGLDSGAHFFETVVRPEGLVWIAAGFLLTVIPVIIVGFIAFRMMKMDFGTVCGMLCGSMANPMALNYANDTIPGDRSSVAYTTVYPLCVFLRVVVAQLLILLFLA